MGCNQSVYPGGTIEVDENLLKEYIQLEKDIAEEEALSPLQPLELKSEQLSRLQNEIQEKEKVLEDFENQVEKEKSDVDKLENAGDAIRATLLELGNSFNTQMIKEKREYLAILNKKEITARELEETKKQYGQVSLEIEELETKAAKLKELYNKQDNILGNVFNGKYGSQLENDLEEDLDELLIHRGRILEANFKWRQAQMMLEYACRQLAVAVQKWQDLPSLPTIDLEIRYNAALETRNNLVAAGQNISGAKGYLQNVDFPYCSPDEVDTLNKATQYIFTDMQTPHRHEHAMGCYDTTHKRANALLQWFDTVINSTIMKDLNEITEEIKRKTLQLRKERIRLIQEKIKEKHGVEADLDMTLRGRSFNISDLAKANISDNQVAKVPGGEQEDSRASTPPLLEEADLAPLPSNTIIFGKMYDDYKKQIDDLAYQHKEELTTFIKDQQVNYKKIQDKLEEKLLERRQRRAKMKLEDAEKEILRK